MATIDVITSRRMRGYRGRIEQAVDHFLDILMPTAHHDLYVEVICRAIGEADGYCTWTDRRERPKEFEIEINSMLAGDYLLFRALAHECVHVAQFATGRMVDSRDRKTTEWEGRSYPSLAVSVPWEIEAVAQETELVQSFLKPVWSIDENSPLLSSRDEVSLTRDERTAVMV